MLIAFFAVITAITGAGCYMAERIDAPRRRAAREAREQA